MYDYLLPLNGNLNPNARAAEGDALVIQKIRRRLLTHRGERPGLRQLGLPFLGWLAVVAPNLADVQARVQAEIIQVAGVREVRDLSVAQNGRSIDISATILLSSGRRARLRFVPTGEDSGNSNPAISLILPMEGGLF